MKIRLAAAISVIALGVPGIVLAEEGLSLAGSASFAFGVRDCGNSDDEPCRLHLAHESSGKVSIPLGERFSVQLDAIYEKYNSMSDSGDQVPGTQTYGAHISYRNPESYLLGVFGGYSETKIDDRSTGEYYGVEAQYYMDRVTLYAQLGVADINNIPDADNAFEGNFGGVSVRYFPKDDVMLQTGFMFGRSSDQFEDNGDWGNATAFFVEGKKRLLDSMPVYLSGRFQAATYTANTEDEGSEYSFLVGVSYEFGGGSLFRNDRRGATLASPMLPGRAVGWAEALD
jgi:hypothetical protein